MIGEYPQGITLVSAWLERVDAFLAVVLAPLALWILISGLDDLFLDLACAWRWILHRFGRPQSSLVPTEAELAKTPRKRIAIFVPLWKEYQVIRGMIEHNVAANRYDLYEIFIGAYPNDDPTLTAVRDLEGRFARVHLALCPHDGPTSKADCMNWIYQHLLLYEEERRVRFDLIVTHDAEDLIHPESLRWVNYYGETHDMVQIPVLPLPLPWHDFVHGVYCDEFAEFQIKELPARHYLGGFVPSCGVGTAYSRQMLERLALSNSNRVFEPECLTEDYESGFRIHRLGGRQVFAPVAGSDFGVVATREYFPRRFRAAVRQRTRWMTGITLQSWELHDWQETMSQIYWFWRDRKGLIGNIATTAVNIIFAYGAVTWAGSSLQGQPWGLGAAFAFPGLIAVYKFTMGLQTAHIAVKMTCCAKVYGWWFALGVPLRVLLGNWINFLATVLALQRYTTARWKREPLVWLKTEHAYPSRTTLAGHKRRLGEILVGSSYIQPEHLTHALQTKPESMRVGEFLVRAGLLSEDDLYEALSLQQNLSVRRLRPQDIAVPVTRALPASVSRKWRVLPFKVDSGRLWVAGPELPSDEMTRDLSRFSRLEIEFHLVTPTDFERLERDYLPGP